MLTLARAKATAGKAGEPLPTVFRSWEESTIRIRQSQLHLFAAGPGVGKSLVSLTLAMRAQVPTYYFSADTDSFTMYLRAAAMLTGYSVEFVETMVKEGNSYAIDAELNKASHIRFNFDPNPDFDDVDGELNAFASAYGEYPRLVVMDNLRNLYDPEGGDFNDRCQFLKERASETRGAFIALHHVTGQYDNGITPVPLDGLIDKISKIPELIVTFSRNPQFETGGIQTMYASPVKNRTGKADPSAQWNLPLRADMPRMRIEG